MRRVAQIMGMPITVDIPGCTTDEIFEESFHLLRKIDGRFSPFKKDSELSKYQREEIPEKKLSSQMKEVIKACREAEKFTNGFFSAWYRGVFEPSGYVKGWAINRAGNLLKNKGFKTFCIGAGGDILASTNGRKTWRIGLQNPLDKKSLTSQVNLKNGAVATSGTYERGEHIINPKTGKPATGLLSISVAGPDIVMADVLATAAFAMGKSGLEFIDQNSDYEALAISNDKKIYLTSGMAELLS